MKQNILVTGSHRSGSTWTGKMLCSGGDIQYVHDPFVLENQEAINAPLRHWFEYLGNDEKKIKEYFEYINYYSNSNIEYVKDRFIKIRGFKEFLKFVKQEGLKLHHINGRKLYKAPIAIFSADFFSEYLNCEVLVLIRHPAAFAESLKSKDWKHDFSHFVNQPMLMNDILSPFKNEINDFIKSEEKKQDIIEHAILLWKLIHYQILLYRDSAKDWTFIKHEDLSADPVHEFGNLFKKFDLPLSEKTKKHILQSSFAPKEGYIKRNSKDNLNKWTKRLSQQEISRIYEGTIDISKHFYSEDEWFNMGNCSA